MSLPRVSYRSMSPRYAQKLKMYRYFRDHCSLGPLKYGKSSKFLAEILKKIDPLTFFDLLASRVRLFKGGLGF